MNIKAEQKFIRISPRKIRLVADVVRNQRPTQALKYLEAIRKSSSKVLAKVVKQALSNAVNNFNIPEQSLVISSLEINEGPTFKRWQPVSRGRAHSVFKRSSHIKVVLTTITKKTIEVLPAKTQVESKATTKKVKNGLDSKSAKKPVKNTKKLSTTTTNTK